MFGIINLDLRRYNMKKKLMSLVLVFALIATTMLTACGGSSEPAATPPASTPAPENSSGAPVTEEPVELVFWTMWDGGDVTVASNIFEEYNATHPNVHIDFQQQDFNQFATKLKTGMMSGEGPDFAISYIGGYVTGLQADDMLVSISGEAKRLGVDIDFGGYTMDAMKAAEIGGEYYAVPCDNLVRVLMYNKALLANTGLLNDDGTLKLEPGYDNFMNMLQTAADKTGNPSPLALTMRPPQLVLGWLTMYEQLGGHDFVDTETRTCTFDEDIAVRALTMYQKIYADYVLENLAPPADLDMFKAGKVPFYIDGSWNVAAAADALGDDFAVTTFPQLGDRNALITTNHAFIVPKKSSTTDAKMKEILEFIKWWGENNYKWSEAGHLPAYIPSTQTTEFANMPWPQYYQSTLDVAVPIYTIPNANLHQIAEVTDPIQQGMLGTISPADAVKKVRENLNQLLPNL